MNIKTQNCQPDLIEAFLKGDLNSAQEIQMTDHLETCDDCRTSLENSAAEPDGWIEASQLLKPTRFDWNRDAESDDLLNPIPLQIRNVLDSLAPADDPEMLGQLGGYEVSGVVGAGAMGVVLKASDKSLDRTVAIKVLSPHLASNGAARKRFAREAKAAAAVLHPNVIAIHGVSNDQSLPHLVMPYVRGTSLQKRISDEGSLPVNEVLRIGAQIAAGLAAAHAQGLVHRDIKPANILLEEGVERVAITDFGLARAVDDASLTRTGIIAGTPQYMSPEQSRGESLDQRSDLFSLGSVMYAMCVGRPPFRSETTYGVIQRINNDQPTPIREINPDVPDWLAAIVMKLIAKSPDDRFESAAYAAELLESCLAHVQQPSSVALPAAAIVKPKPARTRKPPVFWGIIAASITAAICFGFLAMFLWDGSDPPEIGGKWVGDRWGNVELKQIQPGQYEGTYGDGDSVGTIELKWSRFEGRFNGTWGAGETTSGELSVRLDNGTIEGASTNTSETLAPGTPRLAELKWSRAQAVEANSHEPENQLKMAALFSKRGWKLWGQQEYAKAESVFAKAVVANPKLDSAWNGLGWALLNQNKPKESVAAFEKCVALTRSHGGALNGLGQANLRMGDYDAAEGYFLKAKNAPAAWHGLVRIYLLQGKFAEADKWLKKLAGAEGFDASQLELFRQAINNQKLGDKLRQMIEPTPVESQKEAFKPLLGTWTLEERVLNPYVKSRPHLSNFKQYDLTFSENKRTGGHLCKTVQELEGRERGENSSRVTLNPNVWPKEINTFGDGYLIQGIYECEGDTLKIASVGIPEIGRPKSLEATPESNPTHMLWIFKRKVDSKEDVRGSALSEKPPEEPQRTQQVHSSGICVRDDDSRPVAEASVRLFLYRKSDAEFVLAKTATTDEQGRYSIRGSVPVGFDLTVSRVAISSADRATTVMPYQASAKKLQTIKLAAPASVTGRVIDADSKPVEGANVILGQLPGVWQTRTDSEGRFEITDVPAAEKLQPVGFCLLMASHPNSTSLLTTVGIDSVPTNVELKLPDVPNVSSYLELSAEQRLADAAQAIQGTWQTKNEMSGEFEGDFSKPGLTITFNASNLQVLERKSRNRLAVYETGYRLLPDSKIAFDTERKRFGSTISYMLMGDELWLALPRDGSDEETVFDYSSLRRVGADREEVAALNVESSALVILTDPAELENGNAIQQLAARTATKLLNEDDSLGLLGPAKDGQEWLWVGGQGLSAIGEKDPSFKSALANSSLGDCQTFDPALQMALDGFAAVKAKRNHMIIMTDGKPSLEDKTLLEKFHNTGIKISVILSDVHRVTHEAKMKQFSDATGGKFWYVSRTNKRVLEKILEREVRRIAVPRGVRD